MDLILMKAKKYFSEMISNEIINGRKLSIIMKLTLVILVIMSTLIGCGQNDIPADTPVTNPEIVPEAPVNDMEDDKMDVPDENAEYIKITPQEAQSMMTNSDVIILDVRTQDEYDEGHIPNAILLPDFEIGQKAELVIKDKSATILVYCRSGRRSENASRELIGLGYIGVYDFGGILDWPGEIVN